MHFNEQRMASLTLALALIMVFQIAMLAGIGLFHYDILHSESLNLSDHLLFFAVDATLFLVIVCAVFSYSVRVNDQYRIHRDLVRINKGIVMNMFRLYPSMVGSQPIKPQSYMYNLGYQMLLKEFGTNFSADELENRLQPLIEAYDHILQDLEYEEAHYPLKLFGIPIRSTLLNSLIALVFTSLSSLIKKYF